MGLNMHQVNALMGGPPPAWGDDPASVAQVRAYLKLLAQELERVLTPDELSEFYLLAGEKPEAVDILERQLQEHDRRQRAAGRSEASA